MTISVGFFDWAKLGKTDGFYPDDMPSEWRLSYYSNEIGAAELRLSDFELEDLDELTEDLNQEFNLILHVSELNDRLKLETIIDNSLQSIKAIITTDLCEKEWGDIFEVIACPVFLEKDKMPITFQQKVDAIELSHDALHIVFINETFELKEWRCFIDSWVSEANDKNCLLMLNPDRHKSSKAAELRMMIEMMGL